MIKSEIPLDFWQRHRILPIEDSLDRVTVGIHKGTPRDLLEDIRLALRKDVRAVMMNLEEIEDGLRRMLVEDTRTRSQQSDDGTPNIEVPTSQDLLTEAAGAPVVRLLNAIFLEAMQNGASDIHIEPYEEESLVRMRVDGVLHEIHRLPRSRHPQIAARVKVMSRLDLAETRRPQDGRLHVHSGERHIDVRVSCVPTLHGERVVMRLLEKDIRLFSMDQLGFAPDEQKTMTDLLSHPYGLMLVTGPTGSGKTTTLYAFLQSLRSPHCNIITIEDPVEYVHYDEEACIVSQREVGTDTASFTQALESALRQAPDVLLVGEMRDPESVKSAVYFAETGHLVLSTLHANNASQTVERVLQFFPEEMQSPVLQQLSLNIRGIVAQRLIPSLDGHRVPAVEIMIGNARMSELLRDGQLRQMKRELDQFHPEGMQSFDLSLLELFKAGRISAEDAMRYSDNSNDMRLKLKQLPTTITGSGDSRYEEKPA